MRERNEREERETDTECGRVVWEEGGGEVGIEGGRKTDRKRKLRGRKERRKGKQGEWTRGEYWEVTRKGKRERETNAGICRENQTGRKEERREADTKTGSSGK